MNVRNFKQEDCICTRWAKRIKLTRKHQWGQYTTYGMGYFADKECKGRCVIDPWHTIRKDKAQIMEYVPVWCIVVPGLIERTETI